MRNPTFTRRTRLFAGAFAAIAALVAVAGCGSGSSGASGTSSNASGGGDKIKIAFIVKQPEEPWFQLEWKFAQQAADKDGFTLITEGATEGDQVLTKIANVAAQGAKGLVICTPDVRLGPSIVSKANTLGLKLISVDDQLIDASGKPLDVHHVGISAHKIGMTVGDSLIDEMKKRGWKPEETGMILITREELDTAKQRTDGEYEAVTAKSFPTANIFKAPEKTTDVPGGHDAATVVLTQHTNFKHWLITGMNDSAAMGAVRATEGFNIKPADVIAIGINGDAALEDFKKPEPTGLYGSILLQAKVHGYDTSDMMYHWIKDGKEPPKITYTDGILITRDNYKQILQQQGLPG